MYDYSYLDTRRIYSTKGWVALCGVCMICEREIYITGTTEQHATYNLTMKYRNHKDSSGAPCIAGVKSLSEGRKKRLERLEQIAHDTKE